MAQGHPNLLVFGQHPPVCLVLAVAVDSVKKGPYRSWQRAPYPGQLWCHTRWRRDRACSFGVERPVLDAEAGTFYLLVADAPVAGGGVPVAGQWPQDAFAVSNEDAGLVQKPAAGDLVVGGTSASDAGRSDEAAEGWAGEGVLAGEASAHRSGQGFPCRWGEGLAVAGEGPVP